METLRERPWAITLVVVTYLRCLSRGAFAFAPSTASSTFGGKAVAGWSLVESAQHRHVTCARSALRTRGRLLANEVATRRRRNHFPRMISLEVVSDEDIPDMAEFFISNFWDFDVPPSQKRALVRELVSDYRRRYGSQWGKRKFPSMLLAARNNSGDIVGCVAIEVSVCKGECVGMKARGISPNSAGAELRPILANLTVGRSARRKGLAKRMVRRCEAAAKEWGFDEVLLLVEENNQRAKRLYQKLGYKTLFSDREAKQVVPDSYQIRDVPCVNVCMRRDLNANVFSDLFNQLIRQ
ncbi:unnamed protein product [Ascophyllum nodosum]